MGRWVSFQDKSTRRGLFKKTFIGNFILSLFCSFFYFIVGGIQLISPSVYYFDDEKNELCKCAFKYSMLGALAGCCFFGLIHVFFYVKNVILIVLLCVILLALAGFFVYLGIKFFLNKLEEIDD